VGGNVAVGRLHFGPFQGGAVDEGADEKRVLVLGGVGLGRARRLSVPPHPRYDLAGIRRSAVATAGNTPSMTLQGHAAPRAKGRTRMSMLQTNRSAVALLFVGLLAWGGGLPRVAAQAPSIAPPAGDPAETQQLPRRVAIRFLTDSDYPPFTTTTRTMS